MLSLIFSAYILSKFGWFRFIIFPKLFEVSFRAPRSVIIGSIPLARASNRVIQKVSAKVEGYVKNEADLKLFARIDFETDL